MNWNDSAAAVGVVARASRPWGRRASRPLNIALNAGDRRDSTGGTPVGPTGGTPVPRRLRRFRQP
jgi:hypothetical protein